MFILHIFVLVRRCRSVEQKYAFSHCALVQWIYSLFIYTKESEKTVSDWLLNPALRRDKDVGFSTFGTKLNAFKPPMVPLKYFQSREKKAWRTVDNCVVNKRLFFTTGIMFPARKMEIVYPAEILFGVVVCILNLMQFLIGSDYAGNEFHLKNHVGRCKYYALFK